MKIKRKATLLLIVCMTVLAGCADCGQAGADIPDAPVLMQETEELLIYAPYYAERWMEWAVKRFEIRYPDVDVTYKVVGDPYASEDMSMEQIHTEIMAGAGPDIVFDSFLNDPYKAMEGGIFLNLAQTIENDTELDLSEFNQAVMDAGVYKGRRYLLPLSYRVYSVIGIEETLSDAGFETEYHDLKSFLRQLSKADEYMRDIPGYDRPTTQWSLIDVLMETGAIKLIDYEKGEIVLDKEELRGIMEVYKPVHVKQLAGGVYYGMEIYDWLTAGEVIVDIDYGSLDYAIANLSALQNETCIYLEPFPAMDGGSHAAVEYAVGIPANCKNQLNAYRFIQMLPYLEEGEPFDECYAELENRLRIYISE